MRISLSLLAMISILSFGCKHEEPKKCKEARIVEFCRPEIIRHPQTGEYISTTTQYELINREVNSFVNSGWQYAGPLHNDGINCLNVLFVRDTTQCPVTQDAGVSR